MLEFKIQLEDSGLVERIAKAPSVLQRETKQWITDMSDWVKQDLKNQFPQQTGTLKSSLRYELEGNGNSYKSTFWVVDYGKWLDEGTGKYDPNGSHIIKPAEKKAMHFNQHGQEWFHSALNGSPGRHFTMQTYARSDRQALKQADKVAERIFKDVIG